jgi:UDP-glucose 4-epimerase
MKAFITGVAGFIGSSWPSVSSAKGADVAAADSFTDYYPRAIKERNLAQLRQPPRFHFVETRLQDADLAGLLADRSHVFHLAAQAGVRKSWGVRFFRLHDEQHRSDTDPARGLRRPADRAGRVRLELIDLR